MKAFIAAIVCFSAPAWAEQIVVDDGYARVARPGAPVGAAFMILRNTGDEADRLIGAASPVAKRVEIHTHIEKDGVMMMRPVEGGIEIAAGGSHALARGGDHVMMMGLTERLADGGEVEVTLTFEHAGDVTVVIPVDNTRAQGGQSH